MNPWNLISFFLHLNDQIFKSALFQIVEEDKRFTGKQTKEKRLNRGTDHEIMCLIKEFGVDPNW